jgi:hypothetical protein
MAGLGQVSEALDSKCQRSLSQASTLRVRPANVAAQQQQQRQYVTAW